MATLQPQSSLGLSDRRSWGKYILAGLIGALAACVAISLFTPRTTLALSQLGPTSADGVFAIQARLSADAYGLYLIDTRNQTILLYRHGGLSARGLSLVSARSFRYDRQLLDFNVGRPSPREVQKLIEAASETQLGSQAPDPVILPEPQAAPPEPSAPE